MRRGGAADDVGAIVRIAPDVRKLRIVPVYLVGPVVWRRGAPARGFALNF